MMSTRTATVCAFLLTLLLGPISHAGDRVQVVASTLDMADFARQIGGDRVEVHAITRGQYDLHFYEPRPSEVVKLRRADLVIAAGMELDAYMPALIDASRNPGIRFGAPGFVDPAEGVRARDVPTERITGEMGDVHPYGNPHFWFTPGNVRVACSNIASGLIRISSENREYFRDREADYLVEVDSTFGRLKERLAPYEGTKVLQFHSSWDYFCETFGLEIVGSVEPKPGIAPSASHLRKLVHLIRDESVKLALVEPFYSEQPLRFLRRSTRIKTLRLPLYLGGNPDTGTYLENLEYIVTQIEAALRK